MTLGIFLLLIFVLYLIDKHDLWRRAARVSIWLVVICILGLGGIYAWKRHLEAENIAYQAKMRTILDCEVRNAQFSADMETECKKNPDVVVSASDAAVPLDFSKADQMFKAFPNERIKALLGKMTQEQKNELYASLRAALQSSAPNQSGPLKWYEFQGVDGKWYKIQAPSP